MDILDLMPEKKEAKEKAKAVAKSVIDAYSKDGKYNWLCGDEAMGELIFRLGSTVPSEFDFQHLGWWMERAVGRQVKKTLIPEVEELHLLLSQRGYFVDNEFDYNDLDNSAFVIPHDKLKIVCVTDQNCNFLVTWDGNFKFHIRQFWKPWTPPEDGYEIKEDAEMVGTAKAILESRWLVETYSDNILDNPYVYRPDLAYFAERDYDIEEGEGMYGDCRDAGYVVSVDFLLGARADRPLHSLIELHIAELDIRCAIEALKEDETSED